jgi:opacity protein-like surface antigen
MKKTLVTVATLTVLAAPMSSMAAADSFYIKGNIGIGMAMDTDIDNLPNAAGTAEMTYDNGFIGSLAVGYDFANPMRMEIELIKQKNDIDITSYDNFYGTFNEGDLKTHSFMLNGYYDVDTGSPWKPFVGAGMGWSKLDINDPGFSTSDSDDVFTYQLIGGVAYTFNDRWSVDVQYRFMGTSEATIDGADFNYNSNDLMLGLRYSF